MTIAIVKIESPYTVIADTHTEYHRKPINYPVPIHFSTHLLDCLSTHHNQHGQHITQFERRNYCTIHLPFLMIDSILN